MNLLDPIKSIMTKELVTINLSDSLTKVDKIFRNSRIHHIPVLDKDKLVGIISKSDYLFFRGGSGEKQSKTPSKYDDLRLRLHSAADIMTTGIAKLSSNDKIAIAVEVFAENIFHSIPIVDDGQLVGILTTYDIIMMLKNNHQPVAA